MTDQAHNLRALVASAAHLPEPCERPLPLVTVTGARASVGATTVALNLAALLVDRGHRVLLVDASQHASETVEARPIPTDVQFTLSDILSGQCHLPDAVVAGPAGIAMVMARGRMRPPSTARGRSHATGDDFSARAQDRLLAEIAELGDARDLVVVDAGRGLTPWSRRFWTRARLNILVTTTDDAAILDAYAVLKESAAESAGQNIRLLVNAADSDADALRVHRRLDTACQRFLSRSVSALPALPRHVAHAGDLPMHAPRVWEIPNSRFGHAALWFGRAVSEFLGAEVQGPTDHALTPRAPENTAAASPNQPYHQPRRRVG